MPTANGWLDYSSELDEEGFAVDNVGLPDPQSLLEHLQEPEGPLPAVIQSLL